MDFEEFQEALERVENQQAEQNHPEGVQVFDFWRATDSDIQRAESELGVALPTKYKEFMLRYGGGQFLFLDILPVVSPDGRSEDLIEVNQDGFREFGFIAVSPVGTGDWWGFSLDASICREQVEFRGHEDGGTERAADDFLEFLVKNGLQPGAD